MDQLLYVEELVILLMTVAMGVGILSRRLRMPYTVGLVLMGLSIALFTRLHLTITPALILGLLVPPLIFEAAFHLRLEMLRRDVGLILALAVPGVILTMLLVAGLVSWGTGFPFLTALLFGALIAATDPVAVVALFRSLGAPKRLQVLLEGESLMNDGTAIVVFSLVLGLAGGEKFRGAQALADFFRIAGGGFVVGLLLGAVAAEVTRHIDEHLLETTLTTVLAYGAYLLAENLHVSGVLAVVAAGLVIGNAGPRGMSPTTRIVVFNFWEYAAFLANSFVFLLIGMQVDLSLLLANWQAILWAIAAVLLARLVGVYGLTLFFRDLPFAWRHVLFWGGLRGAISLALALGLPTTLAGRPQLLAMAFGVVLFTLLVQGPTMEPLIRRLQLVVRTESQLEYERRHARAVAARAAYQHLRAMHRQGLLAEHTWRRLEPLLDHHVDTLAAAVQHTVLQDPSVEVEELDTARREALSAQRSTLNRLLMEGVISEETFHELVSEVDAALANSETSWASLLHENQAAGRSIRHLLVAIIHKADQAAAQAALRRSGCPLAYLPSQGGFLKQRNVTLLIGVPAGRLEDIIQTLQRHCKQRVEFKSGSLGRLPLPAPQPVQVGGITAFVFPVERFEVF